jgi:glycosyltransferase involved in cell wall biosynthesis
MSQPLVSVICVSYNHANYLEQALDSVIQQYYSNIELIIIDDGSSDGSGKLIKRWMVNHPEATMILNGKNIGYCKTFNKAFQISKGEYIIDLAADDLLLPDHTEQSVNVLQQQGDDYGVLFSDAEYINEVGKRISLHSDRFPSHSIPTGDIYNNLIEKYFICSPTMVIRRSVLDMMGGYDEALAFEDFDLWIRASRNFKFIYSPHLGVKKRILITSMSTKQFKKGDAQRWSTLEVCKKIKLLNRNREEKKSLKKRLSYEIFISLKSYDFTLANAFWKLYKSI